MEFTETEAKITLHGLGFIQVKLEGNQRIHVWHPELPKRKCFASSQIHNHRFAFMSTVLVGRLCQTEYILMPQKPSEDPKGYVRYVHNSSRGEHGNRGWRPDGLFLVQPKPDFFVHPGESYSMRVMDYHMTQPVRKDRPLVTLMRKTVETTYAASTLCAAGVEPDTEFDRHQLPEDMLWALVAEAMQS